MPSLLVDTYAITLDAESRELTLRTSNKKYFKRAIFSATLFCNLVLPDVLSHLRAL